MKRNIELRYLINATTRVIFYLKNKCVSGLAWLAERFLPSGQSS
jgi:hypothetical protein